MTEHNQFIKAYLDDFAKRVYNMHLTQVEDLAAAFIARYGCDPEDAEVVTHYDEDTMTWTSHMERRRRGSTRNGDKHRAVPVEMGPMSFGRGSQRLEIGRELPIGDESDALIARSLAERGIEDALAAFALGEVSFHAGWTAHHAGSNRTRRPRCVHTVIYIDRDMRLAEPQNSYE